MKTLLVLLAMLVTSALCAQTNPLITPVQSNPLATDKVTSPTTETEYMFATRGYRDVLEKGADMKMGYEVHNIGETIVVDKNYTNLTCVHLFEAQHRRSLD
jgi:hypothetical protein